MRYPHASREVPFDEPGGGANQGAEEFGLVPPRQRGSGLVEVQAVAGERFPQGYKFKIRDLLMDRGDSVRCVVVEGRPAQRA